MKLNTLKISFLLIGILLSNVLLFIVQVHAEDYKCSLPSIRTCFDIVAYARGRADIPSGPEHACNDLLKAKMKEVFQTATDACRRRALSSSLPHSLDPNYTITPLHKQNPQNPCACEVQENNSYYVEYRLDGLCCFTIQNYTGQAATPFSAADTGTGYTCSVNDYNSLFGDQCNQSKDKAAQEAYLNLFKRCHSQNEELCCTTSVNAAGCSTGGSRRWIYCGLNDMFTATGDSQGTCCMPFTGNGGGGY